MSENSVINFTFCGCGKRNY